MSMNDIYYTLLAKPYWVFDLDNTLYDADADIFVQMDTRMRRYILQYTDIEPQDEYLIRKQYLHDYGNSLIGLSKHHGVDVHHCLEYIHDLDYSKVFVCPTIVDGIKNAPVKKFIHTNGARMHGVRMCAKLGITAHMQGIFGFEDGDFVAKPHAQPYDMMWAKYDIDPAQMVFFEDTVHNLEYPKQHGATTVYINRYHGIQTDTPAYVDVMVQDLANIFEYHR